MSVIVRGEIVNLRLEVGTFCSHELRHRDLFELPPELHRLGIDDRTRGRYMFELVYRRYVAECEAVGAVPLSPTIFLH
jgi:hypothetical protein